MLGVVDTLVVERMFGVDIQILRLRPQHRHMLFTLLKLQLAKDIEPMYCKIPEAYHRSDYVFIEEKDTEHSTAKEYVGWEETLRAAQKEALLDSAREEQQRCLPPFGVFAIFDNDSFKNPQELLDHLSHEQNKLLVEIYHDRKEMDLICKGIERCDIKALTAPPHRCSRSTHKIMMSARYLRAYYMELCGSSEVIKVALWHKGMGEQEYVISAGYLEVVITLYSIDCEKLQLLTPPPPAAVISTDICPMCAPIR